MDLLYKICIYIIQVIIYNIAITYSYVLHHHFIASAVFIFCISWYCVLKYALTLSVCSPPSQVLYRFCTTLFSSGLLSGRLWYIFSNVDASSRGWMFPSGLTCAPPFKQPNNNYHIKFDYLSYAW